MMKEKVLLAEHSGGYNIPSICLFILSIASFVAGCIFWGHPIDYLECFFEPESLFFTMLFIFCLIGAVIVFFGLRGCEIVISDKRIYGKAGFGISINLPLDKVSAVSTSILSSVSVSTSSGRITFWMMNNRNQICDMVNELLINRQNNSQKETDDKSENNQSVADEIRKYKDLYDAGIITEEEYEAKKKQLLRL